MFPAGKSSLGHSWVACLCVPLACAPSTARPTPPEASASNAPPVSRIEPRAPSAGPQPPRLVPSAPLVDPDKIVGYVRCKDVSEELRGKHEAEVVGVQSEPLPEFGMVTWHVELRIERDATGELRVLAPPALPIPLRTGDRVRIRVLAKGGGPNRHFAVLVEALDDTLLLAVDAAPNGWQVERGADLGTTNEGSYSTTSYGAAFTHGATHVESKGKWLRADVDGVPHYLWGSGASRKLPQGKPAMPDYVGGWLDSAIVRAR